MTIDPNDKRGWRELLEFLERRHGDEIARRTVALLRKLLDFSVSDREIEVFVATVKSGGAVGLPDPETWDQFVLLPNEAPDVSSNELDSEITFRNWKPSSTN